MVVLSLVVGFVNESSILEISPTIINRLLVGPIILLNECTFLVPLASKEEVKKVCNVGASWVITKDGPYALNLSPWSAKLGEDGRALGEGQWILI